VWTGLVTFVADVLRSAYVIAANVLSKLPDFFGQVGSWLLEPIAGFPGKVADAVGAAREDFGQFKDWVLTTVSSALQGALRVAVNAIVAYVSDVEAALLAFLTELSKFNAMGGDADIDRTLRAAAALALSLLGLRAHVEVVMEAFRWAVGFVDRMWSLISQSQLVALVLGVTGLSGPGAGGLLSTLQGTAGLAVGSLVTVLVTFLLGSSGPFGYVANSRLAIGLPPVTFQGVQNFAAASGLSRDPFIGGFLNGLGAVFPEIDWWEVADYVVSVVALIFGIFVMFVIALGPYLFTNAPLAFFYESLTFAVAVAGVIVGHVIVTLLAASMTLVLGIATLILPGGAFEKFISVIEMALAGMILTIKIERNRTP
jgi:hypothetical protein